MLAGCVHSAPKKTLTIGICNAHNSPPNLQFIWRATF